MRSVTSCFNRGLFRSNLRRFWPLWALYALAWILLLPVSVMTSSRFSSPDNAVYLLRSALQCAVIGGLVMAVIFGLFFAMASFSYLTSPRATCGMHAMPLRREALFCTSYLCGLFCQVSVLLPVFLFTALLVPGIAAGLLAKGLTCALLFTLFFYSFGVLCMAASGQMLAAPVFYGILNVLAVAVETLLRSFSGKFLFGYDEFGRTYVTKFLSPVVKLADCVQVKFLSNENYERIGVEVTGIGVAALYALSALALVFLALLLCRSRKSEDTGSTVALPWLRPVFQYGVAFCAAISLGQGIDALLDTDSLAVSAFCAVFAGLIGYFAAEMLLKKSVRVLRGSWKGALATAAVVGLLVASFPLDPFGYEAYVPQEDAVESAYVWLNTGGGYFSGSVSDPDTLESLLRLHRTVVENRDTLQSPARDVPLHTEGEYGYASLQIEYQLKDGQLVSRIYNIVTQRSRLDVPDSPERCLTGFLSGTAVAQARMFGRSLPDVPEKIRFTGGTYCCDDETGRFTRCDLSAAACRTLLAAALEDCKADSASGIFDRSASAVDDEPRSVAVEEDVPVAKTTAWLELYFNETVKGMMSDTDSLRITLTPEMTHTLQALRALGADDLLSGETGGALYVPW